MILVGVEMERGESFICGRVSLWCNKKPSFDLEEFLFVKNRLKRKEISA